MFVSWFDNNLRDSAEVKFIFDSAEKTLKWISINNLNNFSAQLLLNRLLINSNTEGRAVLQ